MAYEPVKIDPNELEVIQEEPSTLRQLGTFGKQLVSQVAQAPFKIAELPVHANRFIREKIGLQIPEEYPLLKQQFKGMEKPTQEEYKEKLPSQKISEFFGTDSESEQPQNVIGKAIYYTAGNWPLLFLGGGTLPFKVASDLASSLGMSVAEKAELGPIAQIGASILGRKGFKYAANKLKKDTFNPSKINKFTSNLYEKEKELGSKIPVNGEDIKSKLNNLSSEIKKKFTDPRKFSDSDKSRLLSNIENASNQVSKQDLTASDIFDIKRNLNKIYIPSKSVEGREFNKLRNIFTEELDNLGHAHKRWGNAWKSADELYSIEKWQSGFTRSIENLADKGKLGKIISNPLTYGTLSLLGNISKGILAPALLGAGSAGIGLNLGNKAYEIGKRNYDFFQSLSKTKDGQKLLWEIVGDSAKESTIGLAQSLNKLDKKAKEFDKEQPDQRTTWKAIDPRMLEKT